MRAQDNVDPSDWLVSTQAQAWAAPYSGIYQHAEVTLSNGDTFPLDDLVRDGRVSVTVDGQPVKVVAWKMTLEIVNGRK